MPDCIVCGHTEHDRIYAQLLKCRSCGFVFADLDLTDDDYQRLYGEGYFKGEEYSDYLADRPVLERNFRDRLAYVRRFAKPEHQRLLEVGAAYGFFLNLAREHYDVTGIDICPEPTAWARDHLDLPVLTGDVATADLGTDPYDIVCLWDTIEHVVPLPAHLERLAALTRPGSLLFATSIDIESLNARWRKAKWRQIHPPTHVWYFSKRTVARLLARHGFELLDYGYAGSYRSMYNILYTLFKLRRDCPRLFALCEKLRLTRGSIYLNTYDNFILTARRVETPAHG